MSGTEHPQVLDLEYPAEAQVVGEIRERFEEFARPLGFTPEEMEDLKMALSEACGNAICHGSPDGTQNRIRVRFEVAGDRLCMAVCDQGAGFQPHRIALPDEEEWKPSGRGLYLMVALMDEVEFDTLPDGTRVRLAKVLKKRGNEAMGK